ncbi:MAG: hypothetical protein AUF79_03075 [Crenarchaeota archaeon 13_1_20CM_2_51_8]|nr:MAG: hypothetical protein AUF79_03075 [Crenarchaeota archaeon 13_1_20CM_2_51_8]
MEFFRHCPQCGRRFHIKLEAKKLVGVDHESRSRPSRGVPLTGGMTWQTMHAIVQDERPVVLDIEKFQYAYKCKHCGHEWSEKHVVTTLAKEERERRR